MVHVRTASVRRFYRVPTIHVVYSWKLYKIGVQGGILYFSWTYVPDVVVVCSYSMSYSTAMVIWRQKLMNCFTKQVINLLAIIKFQRQILFLLLFNIPVNNFSVISGLSHRVKDINQSHWE